VVHRATSLRNLQISSTQLPSISLRSSATSIGSTFSIPSACNIPVSSSLQRSLAPDDPRFRGRVQWARPQPFVRSWYLSLLHNTYAKAKRLLEHLIYSRIVVFPRTASRWLNIYLTTELHPPHRLPLRVPEYRRSILIYSLIRYRQETTFCLFQILSHYIWSWVHLRSPLFPSLVSYVIRAKESISLLILYD